MIKKGKNVATAYVTLRPAPNQTTQRQQQHLSHQKTQQQQQQQPIIASGTHVKVLVPHSDVSGLFSLPDESSAKLAAAAVAQSHPDAEAVAASQASQLLQLLVEAHQREKGWLPEPARVGGLGGQQEQQQEQQEEGRSSEWHKRNNHQQQQNQHQQQRQDLPARDHPPQQQQQQHSQQSNNLSFSRSPRSATSAERNPTIAVAAAEARRRVELFLHSVIDVGGGWDTLALTGVVLLAAAPGVVAVLLPVTRRVCNTHGTLHGGAIGEREGGGGAE